jgi:hypothetical protein
VILDADLVLCLGFWHQYVGLTAGFLVFIISRPLLWCFMFEESGVYDDDP